MKLIISAFPFHFKRSQNVLPWQFPGWCNVLLLQFHAHCAARPPLMLLGLHLHQCPPCTMHITGVTLQWIVIWGCALLWGRSSGGSQSCNRFIPESSLLSTPLLYPPELDSVAQCNTLDDIALLHISLNGNAVNSSPVLTMADQYWWCLAPMPTLVTNIAPLRTLVIPPHTSITPAQAIVGPAVQ